MSALGLQKDRLVTKGYQPELYPTHNRIQLCILSNTSTQNNPNMQIIFSLKISK